MSINVLCYYLYWIGTQPIKTYRVIIFLRHWHYVHHASVDDLQHGFTIDKDTHSLFSLQEINSDLFAKDLVSWNISYLRGIYFFAWTILIFSFSIFKMVWLFNIIIYFCKLYHNRDGTTNTCGRLIGKTVATNFKSCFHDSFSYGDDDQRYVFDKSPAFPGVRMVWTRPGLHKSS